MTSCWEEVRDASMALLALGAGVAAIQGFDFVSPDM